MFDRRTERFYNEPKAEECYNLNSSFIKFMLPRLKLFKKDASKVINYDFTIVDEIIEGFELFFEYGDSLEEEIERNVKVDKAIELFSKHWRELWW